MHGRCSLIQIDGCGDCAKFTIRNRYHTKKISISLIKTV